MDIFSKAKRSEIMSHVRYKDSKIELLFRKELWIRGYRYRKNSKKYFGKPDIVLHKYKTVIFIDSCFWHGCKQHYKPPNNNYDFWMQKIKLNKKRDIKVTNYYRKFKWKIIRIWEHELNNAKLITRHLNIIKK